MMYQCSMYVGRGEGFLKHSEMVGISEISAKQAPAEFEESP